MENDEIILMNKLREGDHHSFEHLFKSYYRMLTLFANRFVNDITIAQEITCDLFADVWEKRAQLEVTGSIKSYLFKMTQNRCLNYLKHKRIESLYVLYLQHQQDTSNQPADFEQAFNNKELAIEISAAIGSLPEQCRTVFKMSRYGNMKYKDIASQLGISQKTVERHMCIAFEKLRKLLKNSVNLINS
ncbi:RNA polymerase sigma-70 factor [Mucilaginibacter litoreus]|uniref:RNA polymerase sigma-70 factor n=1 Tax=Mucilaginibacter litoreus TaxID=1048221 RepID=A0ABW3ATX7_9SPHI